MKKLLHSYNAPSDLIDWCGDKSWPEFYATCPKGFWMHWLFSRTNPSDLRLRILVAARGANTIRDFMESAISRYAIDTAIKFASRKVEPVAIRVAREAANFVHPTALIPWEDQATYAAIIARASAFGFHTNSSLIYPPGSKKRKKHEQKTADICRKYLPIEIWKISNNPI